MGMGGGAAVTWVVRLLSQDHRTHPSTPLLLLMLRLLMKFSLGVLQIFSWHTCGADAAGAPHAAAAIVADMQLMQHGGGGGVGMERE